MTRKVVQSAERQLVIARARIEKLETENHELRTALSKPTLQNKKHIAVQKSTPCSRKDSCGSEYTSHSHNHSPDAIETPSYARPTRASRLRRSQSPASHTESTKSTGLFSSSSSSDNSTNKPKHVGIHGKSCVYQRGKLIEQDYGFLMSTEATINRFGDMERYREERCGIFRPSLPTSRGSSPSPTALPEIAHHPRPEPPKPTQIMSREEFEDMTERKGIELRTRLDDDDWLSDPANNLRMDHDELFDILSRAERLAKQCLWRWFRVNHPNTCMRMGLNYLSDMDLGRHPMEALSNRGYKMLQYRHTESAEVHRSIQDVIQLRNRVHHFNGTWLTMKIVDEYLFDVQNLAVNLYDEESASNARNLRDRLRQGAEGVAGEIEALRLLMELPFAERNPWQHHHVESFRTLTSFDSAHTLTEDAPLFIAAAYEWHEAGCPSSPEPDIGASLANVRRLENGGHTGMIGTESERPHFLAANKTSQPRLRSSSMGGFGGLSLRGQQTQEQSHVQNSKRRASFSIGRAATYL